MTTAATNLGVWAKYTPDPWPEGIPSSVMFAKRNSDGVDWYTFSKGEFAANTVLAVAIQENGYWTIKNAAKDYPRLWPDGMLLLSFVDATTDDPLTKYQGMVWSGGNIIDLPWTKSRLTDYASSKRYDKETSGVSFNGHVIATDDRSKVMLMGSVMAAQLDPSWTTVWQEADGSYNINASTVIAMASAVQAHVNACFTKYADVTAAITAGTITTTTAIDEAFASVQ